MTDEIVDDIHEMDYDIWNYIKEITFRIELHPSHVVVLSSPYGIAGWMLVENK